MVGLTRVKLNVLATVLGSILFDLCIGVECIASFVLAGVAGAFLVKIGPQLCVLGFKLVFRCSIGITSIFAVQTGLQQLNLDISDGEGVLRALRIREIRKRGADDGDSGKCDAHAEGKNLLFHWSQVLSFFI